MTETELRQETIRLCRELGLLYHHCSRSEICEGQPGFPDLTIAGPRDMVVAELKSADGDTSPVQDLWLWTLGGRRSVLWRPADLESGRIKSWLRELV